MKDLKGLLSRLTHTLDKKRIAKENIASIVKKHTNINLSIDKIFVKDMVVEIESSPVVKNEIVLKQDLILKELKDSFGLNLSRVVYK